MICGWLVLFVYVGGGVMAVFMRSFLYSVAARMHFLSSRRFIFLAAV